jgi:hypothetical protein
MTPPIGKFADSSFLRTLIKQKEDEIMSLKKKIRNHKKFIDEAKLELQGRGENVNG